MTVRDLLLTSEDVDIANDATDALFPALCPPLYLTPEGEKHFARALDIPVELHDGCAVLLIDGDSWKASYRAARELFTAGAGYCSCEDWDRWFYEDEPEKELTTEDTLINALEELKLNVRPALSSAYDELGTGDALTFFREYDELESKLEYLLYELSKREARERFFSAVGIPDDGRKEPFLTKDELKSFTAGKQTAKTAGGKPCVTIYYEQEAYGDRTYSYCPELDVVLESWTSCGD